MIKYLSQFKDALSKLQGTWAWVGQRGIDALSMLDFLSIDAGFCCDFGEVYTRLWTENSLFSVEQELGRRENWGNQDLEMLWQGPTQKKIEAYLGGVKKPINSICYRSLKVLEKDSRFRVLAPPLALKDLFDDKLRQLELFSTLGVKTPTTVVCSLGETTFTKAGDIFNGPFVVQPPVGSSGENTYFINNETDFEKVTDLLEPSLRVKLSKYLPVPSLNGHCVVLKTRKGLRSIAACPSIQIVGSYGCTSRAETYCGNDFSAASRIPNSIREEICTTMEKIGLFMGTKGFLGLFGMDFLLNGEEVLALEINPRFQGSTMLLSLLQVDRDEVPLAALHVMQFLGLIEEFPQDFLNQSKRLYRTPYEGAHLIVHSLKDEPCCIEHDIKAGIYTLVNNAIKQVRNGTTCRDIQHPDEWCILGNLPGIKTKICRGARIAMIQTRKRVMDSHLKQLESYAATFVRELQGRCKMLPFNGGSE
jgi:hypothetical protein